MDYFHFCTNVKDELLDNFRKLEEGFQRTAYLDCYGISSEEQLAISHLEVRYALRHMNYLYAMGRHKERFHTYFYCKTRMVALMNITGLHFESYSNYGYNTCAYTGPFVNILHINKYFLEFAHKRYILCPSVSDHMKPYKLTQNIFVIPFIKDWWDVLLHNSCRTDLSKYKVHRSKIYAHDLDIYTCTGITDYFTALIYKDICTCEDPIAKTTYVKRLFKIKPLVLPTSVITISLFKCKPEKKT